MADPEHLAVLKQGVCVWNEWRGPRPDIRPDLSDSALRGADLMRADLYSARLRNADPALTELVKELAKMDDKEIQKLLRSVKRK